MSMSPASPLCVLSREKLLEALLFILVVFCIPNLMFLCWIDKWEKKCWRVLMTPPGMFSAGDNHRFPASQPLDASGAGAWAWPLSEPRPCAWAGRVAAHSQPPSHFHWSPLIFSTTLGSSRLATPAPR